MINVNEKEESGKEAIIVYGTTVFSSLRNTNATTDGA
jgi:hypothetical protein